MSMFRFWASESRGSERSSSEDATQRRDRCDREPMDSQPSSPITPGKRRPDCVDTSACAYQPNKRVKTEDHHGSSLPSPVSATADREEMPAAMCQQSQRQSVDLDAVRETIEMQFGLEILLKHKELRLINQELARCQIALEQLRRCHLMPYPVQCPTPQQMLDIASGKGPALKPAGGEAVPKWAPPFGVVEGPYARHYAKWLIPDPVFDGIQPEHAVADGTRARAGVEGRATRNSGMSDAIASLKGRPVRGVAGQKLHALSSGYSQPRDKQLGCILKRPDGVMVKLVCLDCHRWDFSSTQGFINHCRIAHKREFKSHDAAAIQCGQPIEVDETGAVVGEERKTAPAAAAAAPPAPTGFAHPLTRPDTQGDAQPYKALLARIKASVEMYKAGKLPGVNGIPGASKQTSQNSSREAPRDLVASAETPYLSQLLKKKNLGGNLKEQVAEAKAKVNLDCFEDENEDSDPDSDHSAIPNPSQHNTPTTSAMSMTTTGARTPAVMRVPSRSGAQHPDTPTAPWAGAAAHGKGQQHHQHHPSTDTTDAADSPRLPETPMYDADEMEEDEVELSPNTAVSNNAPSLVSDDGEYDDDDDSSSADDEDDDASSAAAGCREDDDPAATGEVNESDVAEINIEDESDGAAAVHHHHHHHHRAPTRPVAKAHVRHHHQILSKKKDEARHVTFVSPTPVPTPKKRGRRKNV